MELYFYGDYASVKAGILALEEDLGIGARFEEGNCQAESEIKVKVSRQEEKGLRVTLSGKCAEISFSDRCCFFRGLGHLVDLIRKQDNQENQENPQGELANAAPVVIREPLLFDMNGPMFDMSQGNAALNVRTVKKILRSLSLMGLSMMMLYTEDTYEVKGQPYFGYMRARYSQKDLKELDDYAFDLGIEMIPCIQTLAHLHDMLRWDVFKDIRDYDACLLVGEEKTYAFLEEIIQAASAPFRTKKIHLGLDEAWQLGRGEYMNRHGAPKPTEMMRFHVDRVMTIARKLGLSPMMWDDMYFRVIGDKSYYQDAPVPKDVQQMVPEGMSCVYWDYYHLKEEEYARLASRHIELAGSEDRVVFAGGMWTWTGFSFAWTKTKRATHAALSACKKLGIRRTFMTTWGDNGTEMPVPATLLGAQMFAEYGYDPDFNVMEEEDYLGERFYLCTRGHMEDLKLLEYLDRTPDTEVYEDTSNYNTAKFLLWQDILCGLGDKNYETVPLREHYQALEAKLAGADLQNDWLCPVFSFTHQAAKVLMQKADMGIRLKKTYDACKAADGDAKENEKVKENEKEALLRLAKEELPALKEDVKILREIHMKTWFTYYKPLGWDIMDLRYGGLIARITSAEEEILAFLEGKLDTIEELDQERLLYNGQEGPIRYANYYGYIVSASRIAAMG